ncbi:hypothetical protein IW261DRAFT_1671032 [Armillaria novae-zelandiae]|uniref:Uncharacterized protein n=1 Tax=Armillaria novae-zelandiae TaxID=153914 RepID=A0AA39NSY3_9AGAR|nr:hypothetical protein IW261DRAFT_1671032 [Armillaria novae-zelandiae]
MHLPRSAFSQHQLDLFLWLLEVNKVNDLPSVTSMKKLNEALQKLCGIESMRYEGALGHKYYLNSLSQMIAQEMGNPKVWPLLEFYPEDAGNQLSEACQASRWLDEAPDDQLTPMFRTRSGDDYYIYKPAMLRDGTVCMPYRWFRRDQKHYARCWRMQICNGEHDSTWRVVKVTEYEVSEDDLLKNFPELCRDAETVYNLPHPSAIASVCEDIRRPNSISDWNLTDPMKGNKWRARADGNRVLTFPIWLYCDDTSGNVSKKWNKHNSFLFTLAGLPWSESQKDYNVHFLCTSNITMPLEMLDGIVEQLEEGQEYGIWAWDCEFQEPVLMIPMVLAMLGDNPMQSEFACHIGLRGKFFCRVCWVKGKDANESRPPGYTANIPDDVWHDAGVDNGSDDGRSDDSDTTRGGKSTGRRKFVETFDAMKRRVTDFVKVSFLLLNDSSNVPRIRAESMDKLKTQFTEAKILGNVNKVKTMHTDSGLKDTFASFFIDKLINSYKRKRGDHRQEALNKAIEEMCEEIMSPVWWIKGLDPHADTPIEILHVILLGFVKYMWRDVIHNQLSQNEDKKRQLMVRLASVNVQGMGLPPLAGHTLVTYCGSLTGRDFHAIAQVAPFVLKKFVEDDCYETWVALSKLIPLIWQPEILDLNAYVTLLQDEIDHFLMCVAQWTCRWFNKPKFHILVHLPEHVRRFGPAMLFATEAFESFNAVIRTKSVHSNRHAPSRDIACAFAQCNRVRHRFSQGLFLLRDQADVRQALTGPKNTGTASASASSRAPDGQPARPFSQTKTFLHMPALFKTTEGRSTNPLCKTGKDVYLLSHDYCKLGGHIVVRGSAGNYVASVEEILQ